MFTLKTTGETSRPLWRSRNTGFYSRISSSGSFMYVSRSSSFDMNDSIHWLRRNSAFALSSCRSVLRFALRSLSLEG